MKALARLRPFPPRRQRLEELGGVAELLHVDADVVPRLGIEVAQMRRPLLHPPTALGQHLGGVGLHRPAAQPGDIVGAQPIAVLQPGREVEGEARHGRRLEHRGEHRIGGAALVLHPSPQGGRGPRGVQPGGEYVEVAAFTQGARHPPHLRAQALRLRVSQQRTEQRRRGPEAAQRDPRLVQRRRPAAGAHERLVAHEMGEAGLSDDLERLRGGRARRELNRFCLGSLRRGEQQIVARVRLGAGGEPQRRRLEQHGGQREKIRRPAALQLQLDLDQRAGATPRLHHAPVEHQLDLRLVAVFHHTRGALGVDREQGPQRLEAAVARQQRRDGRLLQGFFVGMVRLDVHLPFAAGEQARRGAGRLLDGLDAAATVLADAQGEPGLPQPLVGGVEVGGYEPARPPGAAEQRVRLEPRQVVRPDDQLQLDL
jgi:hypothetical protein